MKTTKVLEIEGTWEEIIAHADQFAGRRVRLIVLSEEPTSTSSEQGYSTAESLLKYAGTWEGDDLEEEEPKSEQVQPSFRPASGKSLLRHAGTWAGEDFEECLQLVYDTRSQIEL